MKNLKSNLALGLSLGIITVPIIGSCITTYAAETTTPIADANAPIGTISKVAITFNGNSKSSKGFTWYTSRKSIGSDLQVVEKGLGLPDFSKAKTFKGSVAIPTNKTDAPAPSGTTNTKLEFLHKAEASGLKANTIYCYRVGDSSLGLWSTGTFQTAPSNGAFSFIDLADPQAKEIGEAELSADTFKKAMSTVPNSKFIALNGDIVDDGSKEYQWDWLFSNIGNGMLNTTMAPVAGNHESNKNSFVDHFDLSQAVGSDTTNGVYYSYDYSNTHFVMLNTNENSLQYNDFTEAQINWMKNDIQTARAKGAKWIIAMMHKGPYTTSNHSTDTDIAGANGVRKKVAPIMAQLGIDLVLQGHDHIYARSKPIKSDGTAASETIITEKYNGQSINYQINPQGTIYLIPATAGPKTYYKNTKIDSTYYNLFDVSDENHASIYGPDPDDKTRPVRSQIQNFESISIDGNKLSVTSYEIDQNKNSAEPYVIDTFGIGKVPDELNPVVNELSKMQSNKVKIKTNVNTFIKQILDALK